MGITIVKPTVGGDNGTWGTELNTALDAITGSDLFAVRTADRTALSATTTLVDDGVLQVTLGVGTYMVEAVYLASGTVGGDLKVAWAFAGTAVNSFRAGMGPNTFTTSVIETTAATTVGVIRAAAAGSTSTSITSTPIYGVDGTNISFIIEKAMMVVTAGGLLKVQVAQAAASGTTTIKAGSYMWARQVA